MGTVTFCGRMRQAMTCSGQTVPMIAEGCHVAPKTVRLWLRSKHAALSGEHLIDLSDKLHVTAHWLVKGDERAMFQSAVTAALRA